MNALTDSRVSADDVFRVIAEFAVSSVLEMVAADLLPGLIYSPSSVPN